MEKENLTLAKQLNRAATIISILVIGLVGTMHKISIETSTDFGFLPPFHSSMNALAAVMLLLALYFIKQKNITAHRKCIYVAMACSALFLASYVLYHITTPATSYCVEGNIRYLYFFLLITHVVLAAVILPFILFTFIRAYTGQIEKHRKMAKWVYPLWLYVAVTGPILYLMLRPCYG